MRNVKKRVISLIIALAAAGMLAGCNKDKGETEPLAVSLTEDTTEKQTDEVAIKAGTTTTTKKYTSEDKTMSIQLPDETWENKEDKEDSLSFESPGKGMITVTHSSGTDVSTVNLPETKEEVMNNIKDSGKNTDKYEVVEFKKEMVGTADEYHTTVKCSDMTEKYVYTIGYDIVSDTDIYSITGLVQTDDDVLLKQIQDAVDSFKVLKASSSSKKNESDSEDVDSANKNSSDTMTIYDSNGNPIYLTKDENGVWKDSSGKTYDAQQYGLMGSDGYWYTYEAPASSSSQSDSSESNNSNTTPETSAPAAETSGFYDQNGNYITVTKDANGNWVDAYGTIYYFGDSGVTDNSGNSYPYKSEGESSGFYDASGNYITVTKDANGNWVDGSGVVYDFGDDGVTDSNGNFYKY